MGGIQADEKPSQWMTRFRHTGGECDRDDVERWALIRQLPTVLRTALEVPTPQLTMNELLNEADDLFATLYSSRRCNISGHKYQCCGFRRHTCQAPCCEQLIRQTQRSKVETTMLVPPKVW